MKRIAASTGVVVALLAVAALTVGGAGATAQTDNASEADPFGAEISSFMQASSAQAEGEVDEGMFSAALARTEDPEERRALIERRQERLQQRQARLEERRSSITPDDGPDVKDRALAAHVAVGAAQLERSVNGTERAAEAAGVNTTALDEIRSNASELRGPEVAALARNISGASGTPANPGPPIRVPGGDQPGAGPPDVNRSNARAPVDIGLGGDGNASGGNGADGDSGGQPNDTGPPEDDPGAADERGNAAGRSDAGS